MHLKLLIILVAYVHVLMLCSMQPLLHLHDLRRHFTLLLRRGAPARCTSCPPAGGFLRLPELQQKATEEAQRPLQHSQRTLAQVQPARRGVQELVRGQEQLDQAEEPWPLRQLEEAQGSEDDPTPKLEIFWKPEPQLKGKGEAQRKHCEGPSLEVFPIFATSWLEQVPGRP